ncbi:MAG: hypothetical protein U5R14_03335 [Gemmatimonadota bacterium]|nr:hypothetical protein [Gemmatimonadota bacterium]
MLERSSRVLEAPLEAMDRRLELLKRGLLQDLLTGRVRVTPD